MGELTQRFVKYLKKNTSYGKDDLPEKWITKKKLFDIAKQHGYEYNGIKDSLRELEELVYIGSVWNGKIRQMEYMFYNMTPEEIQSREDDIKWFDSL